MKRSTSMMGFIFGLMLTGLLSALPATAQEKILNFESRLEIMVDGSMEVTETILVRAQGQRIKRGIYRDFPTRYKDKLGHKYIVDFDVLAVLKNDEPEPYHLESQSNGERVYIGSKDVILQHGIYKYTLKYRTNRQLGFFEDHDELYWNVTGNGWEFAMDRVSAEVVLPGHVSSDQLSTEAYTGYQGDTARFYRARTHEGHAHFVTTQRLLPRQGLTIVVAWPKGIVREPSREEKIGYFFRDNLSLIVGLGGLGFVFLYYFLMWWAVGKDPEAGTIIPRYNPPKGLSPAAVRYIRRMGYDNRCFAVTVINLAVKRMLSITQTKSVYTLNKQDDDNEFLFKEENKLYSMLPAAIELKNKNHAKLRAAQRAVKKILALQSEKIHFIKNTKYMVFGVIGSFIVAIVMGITESIEATMAMVFIMMWMGFWSVMVFSVGVNAWRQWKLLFSGTDSLITVMSALMLTIVFIPVLGGEVAGLVILGVATSVGVAIILVLLALTNYLFYRWLKAPTHAGRKLLDEIEGFRMFLSVTEQERLEFLHPPNKTPELFEKYLPYALALDVEQLWAEQFSEVLAQAGQGGEAYQPVWYQGSFRSGNYGSMASSMASGFTSAIASASTAPGSSSGGSSSSGGGSSGGGGGGGGGGGW